MVTLDESFLKLSTAYKEDIQQSDFAPSNFSEAIHQAIKEGLLSHKHGYFLMACGANLNPNAGFVRAYFTTKEYCQKWKDEFYKDALYSVDVCYKE